MENTVVGVYDNYSQAQSAMNELLASGFSRDAIRISPEQETSATASGTTSTEHESGIGHFFRSLFGMEDDNDTRGMYSEAMRRGSVVLSVDADSDEQRDRASDIMGRYDPIDIDERATQWRSQGWTGYDASAPMMTQDEIQRDRGSYASGQTTRIPVVEEELKVGKREVQRGGVRVFQRVKETPVHDSVTLREEHVTVDRHPVDQPATEADLSALKEGAVEMREMAEEPVVEKAARIVEEVVLGKEVSERTEQIDDSVRKTDVEVEQLSPASAADTTMAAGTTSDASMATTGMTDDSDYRRHWQSAYGQSGGRYEDYDAAYRYGSTLAGTDRFRNYRWDDVEPDVRRDWEAHHPGSTWDKVKDAVRYGAERMTGRH